MKTLCETLFDQDLASALSIQGIVVDDKIWKECVKSFNWFRKDVLKQNDFIRKYVDKIIYNEDDCVIFIDPQTPGLTVICPETIWYNFVNDSLSDILTSGDFVKQEERHRRFNLYSCSFGKRPIGKSWYSLEYTNGIPRGYMPITISDRAKKIIENK